jgi:hypothetical protein
VRAKATVGICGAAVAGIALIHWLCTLRKCRRAADQDAAGDQPARDLDNKVSSMRPAVRFFLWLFIVHSFCFIVNFINRSFAHHSKLTANHR